MDELRGFTAIDTVYELKGFQIAMQFQGAMGKIIVALLIGFGILRALHKAGEEGRFRGLLVYLAQAFIVLAFLAPVRVNVALPAGYVMENDVEELLRDLNDGDAQPSVTVPRIMAWGHLGIDALTRILIGSVNKAFPKQPYALERAAVRLRAAKIHDSPLRDRYYSFVLYCYWPVLAGRYKRGEPHPERFYDPFRKELDGDYALWHAYNGDGVLLDAKGTPTSDRTKHATCAAIQGPLLGNLKAHVASNAILVETGTILGAAVEAARPQEPAGADRLRDLVFRSVLYNETNGLLQTSEIKTLGEVVPGYGLLHTNQQTSSNPEGVVDSIRSLASFLIKLKQSVDQWIDHHAQGPATYYKVVCFAPYLYGIAMMLIIAIFPFAGCAALLPGGWTAILQWAKYLLWIKLWLVFWSILSAFNWWRYSIEDLGSEASNGIGDASYIWPAIALMYLVTPGLSLVVVQLLAAAGSKVSNAMAGGMGAGGASQHGAAWSAAQKGAEAAAPYMPSMSFGGGGGGGESGGGGGAGAEAPPPPVA